MITPQVELGPFTFHLYGLIIAVAVIIGWNVSKRLAKIYKVSQKIHEDKILFVPLFLAIIFARFYHVIDYSNHYISDPIKILMIQNGGLGIWGALLGLFLGLWIVSKIRKISFLTLADITAPSLILAQAIGRVGNYFNQEGFGPPTQKPWGVFIDFKNRPQEFQLNTHFHPTFFYEAILNLIFFVIIFIYAKNKPTQGKVFALYLILYSSGRFIVEHLRIDTWTVADIKVAYLLSAIAFVIGLYIFVKRAKDKA